MEVVFDKRIALLKVKVEQLGGVEKLRQRLRKRKQEEISMWIDDESRQKIEEKMEWEERWRKIEGREERSIKTEYSERKNSSRKENSESKNK